MLGMFFNAITQYTYYGILNTVHMVYCLWICQSFPVHKTISRFLDDFMSPGVIDGLLTYVVSQFSSLGCIYP